MHERSDMSTSMDESHQEEERMINHIEFYHGLKFKDYGKDIRNCCTWHAVEDLWAFHRKLPEGKYVP